MDIYITEKNSGSRIALSMLPEKALRQGSTKFQDYDIINIGEVRVPRGTQLLTFSWSGMFPGASRRNASYVKSHHWRHPKELESIIDSWRIRGDRLILMVTETSINYEVLLQEFSATNEGGCGDISYEISFVEAKDIQIYASSEMRLRPSSRSNLRSSSTRAAPAAASANTYTVRPGDNLWNISRQYLNSGSRYSDIYDLNRNVIGSDPNLLYPGQVLTLPN